MTDFLTTYPFASLADAKAAAGKKYGKTLAAFGGRRDGVDRYQLRAIEYVAPTKASRQACDSRKTSAKAICVKLYKKFANDRAAFLDAAKARAIKPLTANTLWNDIKAGRVA